MGFEGFFHFLKIKHIKIFLMILQFKQLGQKNSKIRGEEKKCALEYNSLLQAF